ncbi:Uncharacterized membrane protein [Shimia gijangensis]|uniref:Uncharacterized membrane protein n=1 Tax=Shimia gijangensis TaxID=1470563 RepID=A0A1M6IDC3_9RHOB|nr:hypothetical protein [Shimia gijangensis]SHJ32451.1 Uncharacterized membrane protein [Shimia gijangensis]
MLKNVLFRGVLFLIPIGFLSVILVHLFRITTSVAELADQIIPVDRVAGVGLTSILAVVFLVILCLLAGLISYLSFINEKVLKLDRILAGNMPGYSFIRGMFGSASQSGDELDALKPVLVTYDDTRTLAFEVERADALVVVFHPDIPTVLAGQIAVVDASRVTPIPIPAHQILAILRTHGRGMGKILQTMAEPKAKTDPKA